MRPVRNLSLALSLLVFVAGCGENRHVTAPGQVQTTPGSETAASTAPTERPAENNVTTPPSPPRIMCQAPDGSLHDMPCRDGVTTVTQCQAADGSFHPTPCLDGETRVIREPALATPVEPLCLAADGTTHPGPCRDGRDGRDGAVTQPQLACSIVGQRQANWPAQSMAQATASQFAADNGAALPYFLRTPGTTPQQPRRSTGRPRAGNTRPTPARNSGAVSLSVVALNEPNVRVTPRSRQARDHVHNGIVLFTVPVSLPANRRSIQDDASFSATLNVNFFKEDVYANDTEILCLMNEGHKVCSGRLFVEPAWTPLINRSFGTLANDLFNQLINHAMRQTADDRTGGRLLALNIKELFAHEGHALNTSETLDILYSGVAAGTNLTSGDVTSNLQFTIADDVMVTSETKLDLRYNKEVCPQLRVEPTSGGQ